MKSLATLWHLAKDLPTQRLDILRKARACGYALRKPCALAER